MNKGQAGNVPTAQYIRIVTQLSILSQFKEYLSQHQPSLYRGAKDASLALQSLLTRRSVQEIVFTRIYRGGGWKAEETASGVGSSLVNTANIRNRLETFLKKYSIQTLLDIPCGDFHWMQHVDVGRTKYIGGEIVRGLVDRNNRLYRSENRSFLHFDILTSRLPEVDAILCRDCLSHLPLQDIVRALENIRTSTAAFLITSTYLECTENQDISMGKFRRINLMREPFFLSAPVETWEDFDGQYADKVLAIWKLTDLPFPAS